MSRPISYPVGAYFRVSDNGDGREIYVPRLPCPHNAAALSLTAEEWEALELAKGDEE
jgi:hypothetical protein